MFDSLFSIMVEFRSVWALEQLRQPDDYGSIAYEYEKHSYPLAMADLIASTNEIEAAPALAFLQKLDPQAVETLGVDLHSGFTLKGQIRKYFYFGDRLDPDYRQRMWQAMHQFTLSDPLDRTADPPRKFWERSEDDCETPVDCRNTDNLRAMRETSVYLMAEETGNESTRLIYKARLQRYVSTLLDIGMGEWDSPVYHGHTTAAYLNLYDFAQDPEVRQLAQDGLDWLFRAAALKYWQGEWNGPAKRIYGDDAQRFFWFYFGDGPLPTDLDLDWIHALTSRYSPPPDAIAIAHRRFVKPVEIRRTHPHYENWKPGLYGPAFYETVYFGHTFQLGSLAKGTGGDWTGFSLRWLGSTGTEILTVEGGGHHAIAQFDNLLLWQGATIPTIDYPTTVTIQTLGDITFVTGESTWLAITRFTNGFALEVGEPQTHGDFDVFKSAVLAQSQLNSITPAWEYQGSHGKRVRLQQQENSLPIIWRNGTRQNFDQWDRQSPTLP
ncbi:MAG: hypothetical protein AAFW84_17310 [Cyanobacteria bacterium J06635_15]